MQMRSLNSRRKKAGAHQSPTLAHEFAWLPLEQLKPCPSNARRHSEQQLTLLAKNIREVGFTSPLLVDEVGNILAGHGRYSVATRLGMRMVPCVTIAGLNATQKRAVRIADNRIA